MPAWPARLAENSRFTTPTAWVEVMPTGLSSTTQPCTSRFLFLWLRGRLGRLEGLLPSGGGGRSGFARLVGHLISSFSPSRSRRICRCRRSSSIRSASSNRFRLGETDFGRVAQINAPRDLALDESLRRSSISERA